MIPNLPLLLAVPNAEKLDDSDYGALYNRATASRRERADRFLHREDKCRSIVGEGLVRLILRELTGKPLDDTMITTNEFGCPAIPSAGFSYSISHSGSWVICAADTGPVGADVERVHTVTEGVAERFFCPEEVQYIDEGNNDAERLQRFFTLWVLKESYIKALGRGFNCPLSSFACLLDPSGTGWKLKRNDPALPELFFTVHELGNINKSLREPQGSECGAPYGGTEGGGEKEHGQSILTFPNHKCATCTSQSERIPTLKIITPQELAAALES